MNSYSDVNSVKNSAGEHFWDRVTKLSINFEEILYPAHGNFEE